jgi:Tfp pilus assembly major pilin PilA
MMRLSSLKKESGFSLVEIMVAAGMIGGIALALMQMQKNATRTSSEFEGKMDIAGIQNEIQQILAVPENCLQTFVGKNAVSAVNTVNAIKFKNTSGVFVDKYKNKALDPNVRYGSGIIKIEDYSLSDAANDVAVATDGTTHLLIRFYKGKLAGVSSTKKITLKVQVNASNIIIGCVVLSNSSEIWTRSTTAPANIFYSAGKVGIGTNAPMGNLDVVGVTQTDEVLFVPIATPGAAVCAASQEGKQRYNSTIKNMEFCDGVTWKTFGGSGLVANWITGPGAGAPLRSDMASALALCRTNGYLYVLGGNYTTSTPGVSWSCTRSTNGLTLFTQGFGPCGTPGGTIVWSQVLCGK